MSVDLFGERPDVPPVAKEKRYTPRMAIADHAKLIRLYGAIAGETCKNCVHLRRYRQSATWMKCDQARRSSSSATDWRARWQACGRFLKREDG